MFRTPKADLEKRGELLPGHFTFLPHMSYQPTHEEISHEAKRLWEQDGRPEGKAEDHWAIAQDELKRRTLVEPRIKSSSMVVEILGVAAVVAGLVAGAFALRKNIIR